MTDLLYFAKVFVMRKVLPILLAAVVYLNPLYPVYAQTTPVYNAPALVRPANTASAPGMLKPQGIERAQDRLEIAREKMASRAAVLKEKLAKFKDKVKAKRTEAINNNLSTVNENLTAYLQQILTRLSNILEKAKTISDNAEADGQDVTALNEAISKVETQWNQANDALKAQQEKDYSIVVNTEETVRADAQTARNSLRNDLKTIRDQVFKVKQLLSDVFPIAKSLRKAGE